MSPDLRSTGVPWMDALFAEQARRRRDAQFVARARAARALMPPGGPADFYKELGFPPVQSVPLHPWTGMVGSRRPAAPPPSPEVAFRKWYADWAARSGINPDPDDPRHQYDYRAAFREGVIPQVDPGDGLYHWPSQFKADAHPTRFKDGVDTRTGAPVARTPFTFTEDMSPAERSVMLRYGPDMLAAARGGVQVGGGPASLLMTQRPAARGGAGVLDYLLNALSTIGAPVARMGMLRGGPSTGNLAPAQWAGYQEGFGATPGFNLYNLTKPIQGHPVGSTVGEQTLKALGYTLPRAGKP